MEDLFQFIAGFQPPILLGLLLLLTIMEYVLPPVPGDTAMLLASSLAGASVLPPTLTFALMVVGSCLGGVAAYYLGMRVGRPILKSFLFKYLSDSHRNKAENLFQSHATIVLCSNRFLPGIRGIMLPLAAIFSYPMKRAVMAMTLSNLIWCTFIFSVGYWFGDNWKATQTLFKSYNTFLAVIFAAVILMRLWSSYRSYSR